MENSEEHSKHIDLEYEQDVDDPGLIPVKNLTEIQEELVLKKIEVIIPILKFSLSCLEKKKEEASIKKDYDKLSLAYQVFISDDVKKKVNLYVLCEDVLSKLYDQYQNSLNKWREKQSNKNNNITNPCDSLSKAPLVRTLAPISQQIVPVLHNVVCTVDLGCRLDLTKIALAARNTEYNPKRFHAVIMRLHEPRTATLVFGTGKLVTTGAKSEASANLAARKCARIIQKLGNPVKFKNFQIQNIVATCDVRFPINLEGIYRAHIQFCSYEPELFAGLIFRIIKPKLSLLIFVTGKFVLTGAKSRAMLQEACDYVYPLLRSFRKQ